MGYQILTDVSIDGIITQKLIFNKVEELARWVCDTREDAIIQALISLGWRPPNKAIQPTAKPRP